MRCSALRRDGMHRVWIMSSVRGDEMGRMGVMERRSCSGRWRSICGWLERCRRIVRCRRVSRVIVIRRRHSRL